MAVSNATLVAQVQALTRRVNQLAAQVKADEAASSSKFATLHPLLVSGNLAFLGNLGKMGFLGQLSTDPNSGTTWVTSERNDYINTPISKTNSVLTELINQGYMFPT